MKGDTEHMARDSSGVAHLSNEEPAEDLYIMAEKRFYGETERSPDDAALLQAMAMALVAK